jgi:ribosomal protein S18 acetylase RimI-like enzyme
MPIMIQPACSEDLQEILKLQVLAYQSEAVLCNNPDIPPLKQTIEELEREYHHGIVLKAVGNDPAILGSVRAYSKDGTLHIGKLIVRPDRQGQGIGTALLLAIEKAAPHSRYELFTSSKSLRNIRLYRRLGYRVFKEQAVSPSLTVVYLEKTV